MSDIVKQMVSNALWGGSSGGGLPTGGNPHQMLVTDAEGKAEWQERLAYEAQTEKVLLPETEFALGYVEQAGQSYNTPMPYDGEIPPDTSKYKVVWNGKTYICKAFAPAPSMLIIGNASLMGQEDTGEPFTIAFGYDQNEDVVLYVTANGQASSATVTLAEIATELKKMPEKFLPDQSELCILNVPKDEDNFSMPDKTYDELLEAYNAGKHIICVYDSDLSTDTAYIMPLTHFYNETFYFGALTTPGPREEATYGMVVATMTKNGTFTQGSYNNIVCYGTIETKNANGFILPSPNGTRYKLTVSDDGTLTAVAL